MSAITYTPLGEGNFTTQQLDRNFLAISDYTLATEQDLVKLAGAVESVSSALLETAKKVEKLSKRPSNLKLVLGLAGCVYIGYQLNELVQDVRKPLRNQKPAEKTEPIHTDSTRV